MSKRRKPPKSRPAPKADAWIDVDPDSAPPTLSPVFDPRRGLGLETLTTIFRRTRDLGPEEVRALYGDGIGRRIVTLPVEQALTEWCTLHVEEPWAAQAEAVKRRAVALDVPRWIRRAGVWRNRDGWTALLQGWGDLLHAEPAPWGTQTLTWVRPAYRWDCSPPTVFYGPDSPRFGEARFLSVHRMRPDVEDDLGYLPGSNLGPVHGSRFTRLSTPTGASVYDQVAQYLVQIVAGGGGVSEALSKSVVGVFKIDEWDRKAYRNDSAAYQLLRSQFEALSARSPLAMDRKTSEFDLLTNGALGGTESALYALAWLLSAASGIPMSVLYGLEPGGFAAGDVQERMWLQRLADERVALEPAIRAVYDGLWTEQTRSPQIPEYELVWPPIRKVEPESKVQNLSAALVAAEKALALGLTTPAAIRAGLASEASLDLWAWDEPPPLAPEDPTPPAEDAPEPPTGLGASETRALAGAPLPELPPPPIQGTWLEAGECSERSGVKASTIRGLGARHEIHRRKVGSRWEYLLEDVLRRAAEAIEGPPEPEDG